QRGNEQLQGEQAALGDRPQPRHRSEDAGQHEDADQQGDARVERGVDLGQVRLQEAGPHQRPGTGERDRDVDHPADVVAAAANHDGQHGGEDDRVPDRDAEVGDELQTADVDRGEHVGRGQVGHRDEQQHPRQPAVVAVAADAHRDRQQGRAGGQREEDRARKLGQERVHRTHGDDDGRVSTGVPRTRPVALHGAPIDAGFAQLREDRRMYTETYGTGRPLVLLHGGYGAPAMFGPVLTALAAEHRVIAPHLRGHGRTPDADGPLTVSGMADDVATLIDDLDGPAAILGFSLGGLVGLQTAYRHPALVRRLVL